MNKGAIIISLLFLIGFIGFVSAESNLSENTNSNETEVCKSLYWTDNTNKNCEAKQFCGAFMYYGLQTFETMSQCLASLSTETTPTNVTSGYLCKDSDGGKNYDTQGTVKIYNNGNLIKETPDYCTTSQSWCINGCVDEGFCPSTESNNVAGEYHNCPNGCRDGACIKESSNISTEQVKEQVTCIFKNSDKEQKCYTAYENERAVCSGIGSCVAEIKGYSGEKITWKSSCGQYQYTAMDGNNEKVGFNCGSEETNVTEIENRGFKNVYFQCYDGTESKSTDREACKSADYWKKFAENFCASHCENDPRKCKQNPDESQESINKCLGKCGVNTFAIGNECYTEETIVGGCAGVSPENQQECCNNWANENSIIKPSCVGKWRIENNKCSWKCQEETIDTTSSNVTITEPTLICKDSCPSDGKCYPFGYRKSGKFCVDDGSFISQKKSDETCENNFECSSNVCVNGKCISENVLEKILNWFKRLFGGN